jgi:sec-independent protein translocase protein TatA
MFGLGWQELLIILIIALIIFGPRKLPEIGKSLGQAINDFRQSTKKATDEAKRELKDIENSISSNVTTVEDRMTVSPDADSTVKNDSK